MAHETHAKTLPADLGAPAFVDGWQKRALAIGGIFSIIAAGLAVADGSIDHVLRAWLLGMMLTFGFAVGGLALLMVQYCSGGKWGLLLRRPLEAMSRTLPLVFVYWVVVALSLKKLYLWARSRRWSSAALKSRIDQRSAGPRHRIQAAHAEPRFIYLGQRTLLRNLGLLHMAAQYTGTSTGCGLRRYHAQAGSRNSKTSAGPASWFTPSPCRLPHLLGHVA